MELMRQKYLVSMLVWDIKHVPWMIGTQQTASQAVYFSKYEMNGFIKIF